MKILDLFCGAGGAAMGLYRVWPRAEIVGVDIRPQPRYPFTFLQCDWSEAPIDGADFVWASPSCQRYSAGAAKWGTQQDHPHYIPEVRERLKKHGAPYVIENIVPAAAHLRNPIMLCGTMFDLGVFRHRLFESSFPALAPFHPIHSGSIGDGKYHTVTGHAGGSSRRDGWKNGGVAEWRIAMGIEWMTGDELAEAIPPAYSRYMGAQLASQQVKIYAA